MGIRVKNQTHWKSSDVKRIVRAVLEALGLDRTKARCVTITWAKASGPTCFVPSYNDIHVRLPKRGPRVMHSNEMVALAAAGIKSETQMLAVSVSYLLANQLAFGLRWERVLPSELLQPVLRDRNSDMPPSWADDATKLVITKYKDPRKDGYFREFVDKKRKAIARAEKDIERAENDIKAAERRLFEARKRKRDAEKALRNARARRE